MAHRTDRTRNLPPTRARAGTDKNRMKEKGHRIHFQLKNKRIYPIGICIELIEGVFLFICIDQKIARGLDLFKRLIDCFTSQLTPHSSPEQNGTRSHSTYRQLRFSKYVPKDAKNKAKAKKISCIPNSPRGRCNH